MGRWRGLMVVGLVAVAAFCAYGFLASAELGAGAWPWRLGYGSVGGLALAALLPLLGGEPQRP